MTRCKYYDCGFCYAPKDIKSNDVKGACIEPEYCPYLKSKMTEKERIEGEIKILQKKLSFLEEQEKTKSPVEEAYKDWWGEYPKTGTWDGFDEKRWQGFQAGYEFAWAIAHAKKVVEPEQGTWKYDPDAKFRKLAEKLLPDDHLYKIADEHGELNPYKQYLNSVEDEKKMEELGFVKNDEGYWTAQPLGETTQKDDYPYKKYTPEETEQSLKEAFVKAQQTEKWKEIQKKIDTPEESWMDKPIDELVDMLEKNPPEFLKFQLSSSLEDRIYKWWNTCFVQHPEWSMEECVEDLLDIIELFLPHSQSHEGTQRIETIIAVDTHNELLRKIKSKLRNKKV